MLGHFTKSSAKRVTAAGLAEAKTRNAWSNADAGDVLGISEGTVRNRLCDDEPDKHHMTVFELARAIAHGEISLANYILGKLCHHHVVPLQGASAASAIDAAQSCARNAAQMLEAAADGVIDYDEAVALLPGVNQLQAKVGAFEARLRETIAAGPARAALKAVAP